MSLLLLVALVLSSVPATQYSHVPDGSTCLYHYGKGPNDTYYYSQLKKLAFSSDDLTYAEDGKAALQASRTQWQNAVQQHFGDQPYYDFFTIKQQGRQTCDDVEHNRLDSMQHSRDAGYTVREW